MDRSKGVMGRKEWFSHLKDIFSRLQKPESSTVPVSRFLECVSSYLPLENPETYSRTSLLALSLEEVQSALQGFSREITWDQVIDVVLQASIQKKAKPNIVEDLSYREIKEVFLFNSSLQHLSLAGNLIEHTKWQFPCSLVLLNLAGNQISEVSFPTPLQNLRLLNLSNNNIIHVENPIFFSRVRELYVAYNLLNSVSFLEKLTNLRILDCSYNEVRVSEELANLDGLLAVKMRGNPLSRMVDLKGLFSSTCKIDPVNISELSEFRFYKHAFEPSKKSNQICNRRSSLSYSSRNSESDRRSKMNNYCDFLPIKESKNSFSNIRIPGNEPLKGFKDIGCLDMKNSSSETKFAVKSGTNINSQIGIPEHALPANNSPSKDYKSKYLRANYYKIHGQNDPAATKNHSHPEKDFDIEEQERKKYYEKIDRDIYCKEKELEKYDSEYLNTDKYFARHKKNQKSEELNQRSVSKKEECERIATEEQQTRKNFDRFGILDTKCDIPVQISEKADRNLEKTQKSLCKKDNPMRSTVRSKEKLNPQSHLLPCHHNQDDPKHKLNTYKSTNALHIVNGTKNPKRTRGISQKNPHRSTLKIPKSESKLLNNEIKTIESDLINKHRLSLASYKGNFTTQETATKHETRTPRLDAPSLFPIEKDPLIGNVLDKASNRISFNKTVNSKQEPKASNKVIVTSEHIEKSKTSAYDNPIKVMMIRPPKK